MAGFVVRSDPAVADLPVDFANAGGGEVAEPTRLYRCRLAGEDGKARKIGVAGKIEQDIDTVVVDLAGQFGIALLADIQPAGALLLEFIAQRIFEREIAVGENFETPLCRFPAAGRAAETRPGGAGSRRRPCRCAACARVRGCIARYRRV